MLLKPKISYTSLEYRILLLSALGFFIHLIDEIYHHADTPASFVLILSAVGWLIIPFCLKPIRGILGMVGSIGVLLGLLSNHIIPFIKEGNTEGLITAIVGVLLSITSGIYALSLVYQSRSLQKK